MMELLQQVRDGMSLLRLTQILYFAFEVKSAGCALDAARAFARKRPLKYV